MAATAEKRGLHGCTDGPVGRGVTACAGEGWQAHGLEGSEGIIDAGLTIAVSDIQNYERIFLVTCILVCPSNDISRRCLHRMVDIKGSVSKAKTASPKARSPIECTGSTIKLLINSADLSSRKSEKMEFSSTIDKPVNNVFDEAGC
jgi:hypothetical protein